MLWKKLSLSRNKVVKREKELVFQKPDTCPDSSSCLAFNHYGLFGHFPGGIPSLLVGLRFWALCCGNPAPFVLFVFKRLVFRLSLKFEVDGEPLKQDHIRDFSWFGQFFCVTPMLNFSLYTLANNDSCCEGFPETFFFFFNGVLVETDPRLSASSGPSHFLVFSFSLSPNRWHFHRRKNPIIAISGPRAQNVIACEMSLPSNRDIVCPAPSANRMPCAGERREIRTDNSERKRDKKNSEEDKENNWCDGDDLMTLRWSQRCWECAGSLEQCDTRTGRRKVCAATSRKHGLFYSMFFPLLLLQVLTISCCLSARHCLAVSLFPPCLKMIKVWA